MRGPDRQLGNCDTTISPYLKTPHADIGALQPYSEPGRRPQCISQPLSLLEPSVKGGGTRLRCRPGSASVNGVAVG